MTAHRRAATEAFSGLHVLADDDPRWSLDPVAQAHAACQGGAQVVQLRAKHAHDAQIVDWGRAIRTLTREAGACFALNDRFDLALLTEADAVHLGQDDLPPNALPATARERLVIGRSTHTLDQAEAALHEGVDYLAFGPLFGTTSKSTSYSERGLDQLREIVRLAEGQPVVAIGGIDVDNAGAIAAAGAAGIAVISAVAAAIDPATATRQLATAFSARPGA